MAQSCRASGAAECRRWTTPSILPRREKCLHKEPFSGTMRHESSSASGSRTKRRSCNRGRTVRPGGRPLRRRTAAGPGRSSSGRSAAPRACVRARSSIESSRSRSARASQLGLDRHGGIEERRLVGEADRLGLADRRHRHDLDLGVERQHVHRAPEHLAPGPPCSTRARRRRVSPSLFDRDRGVVHRRIELDLRLTHAHAGQPRPESGRASPPRGSPRAPPAAGTAVRRRSRARARRPRDSRSCSSIRSDAPVSSGISSQTSNTNSWPSRRSSSRTPWWPCSSRPASSTSSRALLAGVGSRPAEPGPATA